MKRLLTYLRLLLLTVSGMLILCIPFANDPELVDGVKTAKVFWFFSTLLLLASSVLFSEITLRKPVFKLSLPDAFVTVILVVLLLTYDWKLNPNPEKLTFIVQSFLLWFMLRSTFTMFHSLRMFYLSIIMSTGAIEAVWGMFQLYGLQTSNHSIFAMTGTFFNPGPFAGYLAIILPISLGMILKLHDCKKLAWWQMRTLLYYFSWICLLLILVVLPATMSRSAWIAAVISCAWVYWKYRIGWARLVNFWHKSRILFLTITLLIIASGTVGSIALYNLKKDSANGRLLMWKVSAQAIAKSPVSGYGLASFPAAYGQAQAEYFRSGKATTQEKMVAGCPEYAFNEFLHFSMEHGVIGTLFFLAWMISVIYFGIRNKRFCTVSGIISMGIFSISSYPLQMPAFWILLIFLSAMAVSGPRTFTLPKCQKEIPYIGALAAIISICLYITQKNYSEAYREWSSAKILYNNKAYEAALSKYEELHPRLHYKAAFLFEKGHCLSNCGRYEESNEILNRAILLSGDPMIHYIIAKNHQQLGKHEEAETKLYHAIDILPERIYPYFLLTKLYADPAYYKPEKLRMAADSVLYKTPKVNTTAIREMQAEVNKILKANNLTD